MSANSSGLFGETVKTVVYAVVLAFLVRIFAYEPFNIPSGSMLPTLLVGDYLFVSKFAFGYSRYSFPWSPPLFEGRIFADTPERGDVVVFKLPSDDTTDFIKRLIGLPGDRIQVKGGQLYLNGQPVPRKKVGTASVEGPYGYPVTATEYIETLPNGVEHRIWEQSDSDILDNTPLFVVPEGHYFMMGDNRDSSQDSRVMSLVGFVPFQNLIGRADIMFFSHDGSAELWEIWKWPQAIRFGRIANVIR